MMIFQNYNIAREICFQFPIITENKTAVGTQRDRLVPPTIIFLL